LERDNRPASNLFHVFDSDNLVMRRSSRKPFDYSILDTPCTICGYKIHPAQLLRIDGEHVRCPSCGGDFIPPMKKNV
jgi:hypothetical protein